jgi:hypothetical protein
MKFLISVVFIFCFPSTLYWINPFALSIADDIDRFRPKSALLLAYGAGLLRDILLFSPRFGLLGISSLIACLGTNWAVRFFSIEGMMSLYTVASFICAELICETLFCLLFNSTAGLSIEHSLEFFLYSLLYAMLLGLITNFFRSSSSHPSSQRNV